MEDLIAQGVDAICVVPNDPEALVPTIEKLRMQELLLFHMRHRELQRRLIWM